MPRLARHVLLSRGIRGKTTKRARRALDLAQDAAASLHHDYVGTEHLLLGLIDERDGVGAAVLQYLAGNLGSVRSAVEAVLVPGEARVPAGDIEPTPRAQRALELAEVEAHSLAHNYLGTEHILLGLVREGDNLASGALQTLGIGYEQTRDAVIRALHMLDTPEPPAARGHVITCRLDARDLDAIDALVEAGVRTTRSDAAAWLIHAGIEANRPVLERVYGTVAEIRRLRDEIGRSIAAGNGLPDSSGTGDAEETES